MNESVNVIAEFVATYHENDRKVVTFKIVTADEYVVLNKAIAFVTLFVSLSGVLLNIINIRTFVMMGIDDAVTVTFLALSISDFCFTLVTLTQSVSAALSSMENEYEMDLKIDPFAVMFFSANVGVVIYIVTVLVTTYLAAVRCLCVAKPLHFKNMFTQFRNTIILAIFPFIAIISQIPVFVHMGMTTRFDPKVNKTRLVLWLSDDRERIKDEVRMISDTYLSFVTQAIVVCCVFIMAIKLRRSVAFRHKQVSHGSAGNTEKNKLAGKELHVVQQVVLISAIFILCHLCKIANAVLTFVNPDFDMGKKYQYVYLILSSSRTGFDCINSSVNFYVYYAFNSKFRSLCFTYRQSK